MSFMKREVYFKIEYIYVFTFPFVMFYVVFFIQKNLFVAKNNIFTEAGNGRAEAEMDYVVAFQCISMGKTYFTYEQFEI